MNSNELTAQINQWIDQLRQVASELPETGACAIASALDLWLWTASHLTNSSLDEDLPCGLVESQTLTDALGGLLSARALVLESHQKASAAEAKNEADSPQGLDAFQLNMCRAQSASAASNAGQICAELVFGTRPHPTWATSCEECIQAEEIDALEGVIPGISYGARVTGNVLESDGSHPEKAGPCVQLGKLSGFMDRRNKLDGCLSGSWLAKQRAAQTLLDMA